MSLILVIFTIFLMLSPFEGFSVMIRFDLGGFLMSREVGRPSLLNEELLEKAKEYLHGGYKEIDNVVPSTAGLCCYL